MSKRAVRFTPRQDGSHISNDTKTYFGQQLDAALDEVYRDVDPLLQWHRQHEQEMLDIIEWHETHVRRWRPVRYLRYAAVPAIMIAWEVLKHYCGWKF